MIKLIVVLSQDGKTVERFEANVPLDIAFMAMCAKSDPQAPRVDITVTRAGAAQLAGRSLSEIRADITGESRAMLEILSERIAGGR